MDCGLSTIDYHYYHTDHLGSSNIITDETGTRTQLYEYTPYGETWRVEGNSDVPHKFTGKPLDDTTGLYYYGARYYDPQIGRFTQADTVVQFPYNPQSLNRYSYCLNNPVKYIDPTGYGIWDKIKEIVEDTKDHITYYLRHPKDYLERKVWEPLKSAGIAFVCSGFNPVAAMAAYSAAYILDTGEGRQIQRRGGSEFFDDVLGMRPGTAYIWSAIVSNTVLTLGRENN